MAKILYLECLLSLFFAYVCGHGEPLFHYEENPLNDDSLKSLIQANEASGYANLFALDNGHPVDAEQVKDGTCKTFPGDKEWPSSSTWDIFDGLLDGALTKAVPIAASCYHNTGVYDANQCAAVQANLAQTQNGRLCRV